MPLLACQDAAFAYEGRVAACGLNFEIGRGDYLCIVGENGSGKSTLIKGLLRQKSAQRGSVLVGAGLRPGEIGYLPQQTAAQKDFPAGAYEVVLSGRLGARGLRPFYTGADREAALENMRRLDIAQLKNRCFGELSGGQQRRVLLARALCAAKKLLLLDEPAAGLDPVARQELYGLIEKINREKGLTVVMVSHDIPGAVRYASHILHMKTAQLFFGTARDYVNSGVGAAFFGAVPPGEPENPPGEGVRNA